MGLALLNRSSISLPSSHCVVMVGTPFLNHQKASSSTLMTSDEKQESLVTPVASYPAGSLSAHDVAKTAVLNNVNGMKYVAVCGLIYLPSPI